MSGRSLDALLAPASVAVLGASERPDSLGGKVWRHLLGAPPQPNGPDLGQSPHPSQGDTHRNPGGYLGRLYAVNPRHRHIHGVPAYRSVDALPEAPDLAVLCTPAHTVAPLLATLGARGTRAAVVLSTGLSVAQQQAVCDAAQAGGLRVLGPHGAGLQVPRLGLHIGLTPGGARPGALAWVSQSGALFTTLRDWAHARGIGFSQLVSLGASTGVDVSDLLDFLGRDPSTRAILLCLDRLDNAAKCLSAAQAAARNKPVVVLHVGRGAAHPQADAVWRAAMARVGLLRVDTLHELCWAAEALAHFRDGPGGPLWVLSNSRSAGLLAADAAATAGVPLAPLSPCAPIQALAHSAPGHPVCLAPDAPAALGSAALQALLQGSHHAVLFIHAPGHAPGAAVSSADMAQALLPVVAAQPQRVLACWLGDPADTPAHQRLRQAGVPNFHTPEDAVRAFALLHHHHRHQSALLQTPPDGPTAAPLDLPRLRELVETVLSDGREWLTEPEAQAFWAAAGLPGAIDRTSQTAPDTDADADTASAATQPAPDHHPSSHTRSEPHPARPAPLPPARWQAPPSLRLGARVDPLLGPFLVVDHAGTLDAPGHRAIGLPPLNLGQARQLCSAQPPLASPSSAAFDGALSEAATVLVGLSQLLADVPEIAQIDIQPLPAPEEHVRVRLSAARPSGAAHFALAPYPQALVETSDWTHHGQRHRLTLRPIRAEDEAQHRAFLAQLDPEDIRLRTFHSRRSIDHNELARLTHIDYAREMAFIATRPRPDGGGEETLGVVRATADLDNDSAEFAVIVRSDLHRSGLGHRLMRKLVAYLRARGTRQLAGTVLRLNTGMLELAQRLGFQTQPSNDPHTTCVTLDLQAPPPP